MNVHNEPPASLMRFFRWYCHPQIQDYIEGDLIELYRRRLKAGGKKKADLMFAIDVLLLCRPGIVKSFNDYSQVSHTGMMKSYIKTGWRNLRRSKLYSTINIVGLTFGIVCFLLIGLYVFDELSFDRQHKNSARICRVVSYRNVNGESTTVAAGSFKLAEESRKTIPGVENVTRMIRTGRANLVDPQHPVPVQETVTIADDQFLEIFDFPLVAGDRRTALMEPNTIVIGEDLAMRIFASKDVLGRLVQFSHMDAPMKITGILKKHPLNSSFTFNSVMSESSAYNFDFFKQTMASDWLSEEFSIYVLLKEGVNKDSIARKMNQLVMANSQLDPGTTLSFGLQPLGDMHLHSQGIVDGARNTNVDAIVEGNPLYITAFIITAIFVILVAGINYTNLTTARASTRIKEIGVRKTIGALRQSLVGQFLVESLMTTSISFILAVLLVYLLLPMFNGFVNKNLSLDLITGYRYWLYAIAFIVSMAFFSGGYAAWLLSGMRPITLLKGFKLSNAGDLSVRKGLVVLQFALSAIMIVGTIVLVMQVRFVNTTELGFAKDLMVVIDVNTGKARSNFQAVKNEMAKIPSVRSVSVTSRVPGEWKTFRRIKIKREDKADDHFVSYMIGADPEFISTYEITLLSGRNFDGRHDSLSVLLNETAARRLGITDAHGQAVEIPEVSSGDEAFSALNDQRIPFTPRVVGIVKDFHFQSLREKIAPLMIAYNENPIHGIDYYSVKIAPTDITKTLDQLKAVMVKNDEREPFEYHFLDDQLARFYAEDGRRQTLLIAVASAMIFIACLGLFGLATYSTEQRVKEIGVRKVLGASFMNLFALLSKEFIVLVLVANAIAFFPAWWATHKWLEEFAYHIQVSWWVFLLAALLAASIALLTVSYQAIKTARSNPVNSLRTE
ncbi:ABC transporter permease [Chryseolinea sp. T2]|uniref:ABC transporter permease n=1 Tax=Chryseolinea sp. T2 TaxID=3129255 RepID=UPI003076DB1D